MGQVPAKYFLPSAPYGASDAAATNVTNPVQPAAVNPQQPLLPPNFGTQVQPPKNPFTLGLILLFALLFAAPAWATTTVTGKMQNLGTGNVTANAFVRFWLRGCSGNQPRINGTSIIAPSQGGVFYFDIPADSSGDISGTIYSTRDSTGLLGGDIECGGSLTAVWYGMQAFVGGKGGPEIPVHAKNTGTLDITQVTPITTNPVTTAPTGDSTYLRLDGGNSPVTGNTQFTGGLTASGPGITSTSLNNIIFADEQSGSDCGAKINAAEAILGSGPGEIWVSQLCGTTWTTAVNLGSIGSFHTLRFVQGGVYTTSQIITMSNTSPAIIGPPSPFGIAGTQNSVVIKQANDANLAEVIHETGYGDTIQDVTIDGNKANNTTSVDVLVDKTSRTSFRFVTLQNAPSHGLSILSTDSANAGNESCCGKVLGSMFIGNGGDGIYAIGTTDWMVNQTESENNASNDYELYDSPGWRMVLTDAGGAGADGLYVHCTSAGQQSNQEQIGSGMQFGNNTEYDIEIVGSDSGGYCSIENVITGDTFAGASINRANDTYDSIHIVGSEQNTITANPLAAGAASHVARYGIYIANGVQNEGRDTVTADTLTGSFGTGDISVLPSTYVVGVCGEISCYSNGPDIPISTSFTTTAATFDNVTVTGMTSSGHCSLTPTNASADSLLTGTYVSAKTTDQITVTHAATSGATFDVMCTPN